MPIAADIRPRPIENTALAYASNTPPGSTAPVYKGGSNVLTSLKGYVERRPGLAAFEGTPTTFTGTIKRIFTWERWDGNFYVFVNEVTGTNSKVYKLLVGTDASFVLIYDDTTSTEPFDFVISNNFVFFTNNGESWKYTGTGTSVNPWGIGMGANNQPTVATSATGISAVIGGYKYVFCYGNSTSGHVSSPSLASLATGNFTNKQVDVTCQKTVDTQVDELRVYRSTDGGDGIFFEITGSPFAHTPGAGTQVVADTTADEDLSTTEAPIRSVNDPPPDMKGAAWYANRLWGFKDNNLYYSGWEEIENGVEEECFPLSNLYVFQSAIQAIATIQEALLVFTTSVIWKITGDSLSTFRREVLFTKMGCRSRTAVATLGRSCAWLDISDTIRVTDGVSQQEITVPIRPDLEGISHAQAHLAFHIDANRNWLVLSDEANNECWVFDLDTDRWMPSWTWDATAIFSGETASGAHDLLLANASNNKLLKMTPAAYQDDGANYAASVKTNQFPLSDQPSQGVGVVENVAVESNAIEPTTVKILADEDVETGTFVAMTSTAGVAPSFRTQGTDLIEKFWWQRTKVAKRAAFEFAWAAANSNFKLYQFSVNYSPQASSK